MATRAETEVWEMDAVIPEDSLGEEPSVAKVAHDFAKFISDSPVNFIDIQSVIPSARFGIMYTVTVGTIESIEKTNEGMDITGTAFSVNSEVLDLIIDNLDRETRNGEGVINTMLRKNLLLIQSETLNHFNWGPPFNTRADH